MAVLLPQPRVSDGFSWDSREELPYQQGAVIPPLPPLPQLSKENNISFTCLAGVDQKERFIQYWEKTKVKSWILVRWEVGRRL